MGKGDDGRHCPWCGGADLEIVQRIEGCICPCQGEALLLVDSNLAHPHGRGKLARRPGMVEDVFALAVGLQIERHDPGDTAALVLDGDVPGSPAGALDGAIGLFKYIQKII